MKRLLLSLSLLVSGIIIVQAYTERNLITSRTDKSEFEKILVPGREWVPFPSYYDREGWDTLFGDYKNIYIKDGEALLDFDWPRVRATSYLEYSRSGNRTIMEDPLKANNNAIVSLLLAELAEGKGRFIDQIIDGVYAASEMTTWALSAHIINQPSGSPLQAYDYPVIDLVSGDMAGIYSWVYYFLHKEFDKIDPEISRRLEHELKTRVLDPYLAIDSWWWDGGRKYSGRMLNNWSPWCLSNVLMTSMLMENDPQRYGETVYFTMLGMDRFLNYIKGDGACEEGPSYWGHAAGKTLDYIDLLKMSTGGNIDMSDSKLIRDMGEYIARSYVGDGWVVNFADASARGGGDPYLVYRFGDAVDSDLLKNFAARMNVSRKEPRNGYDIFRTLQALKVASSLNETKDNYSTPSFTWYPETQFCYQTTTDGLFFAAKGGFNDESHNHNDVGTFSLWADNFPIIIDAGVGTYTRKTFSKERYTIWTMQSGWHNLPAVNGVDQAYGRKYKATDVSVGKGSFTADIAGAYPDSASVKTWKRSYSFENREVTVTDRFVLESIKAPNVVNFMTWGEVDTSMPGIVQIAVDGHKATISYDPSRFKTSITEKILDDKRLSNVWGDKIYRISFTDKKPSLSGKYTFKVRVQ